MGKLSQLPNIGTELEKRLEAVEIFDISTLLEYGSKEAFKRLRLSEGDTCFNALCALEGAIQNKRWHYLSPEIKADLKGYFESFQ